jgi:hypothetical protein
VPIALDNLPDDPAPLNRIIAAMALQIPTKSPADSEMMSPGDTR